jgi:hypothetical protein
VTGKSRLGLGAAIGLAAVLAFALIQKWPEREPEQSPYWRRFADAGPQVGDRLPDFSLPDTTGRMRTLADLTGPEGLVLVFNQSTDW